MSSYKQPLPTIPPPVKPKPENDIQNKVNIDINLNDIYILAKATEKALNQKVYSKEEVTKIFPIYDKVVTTAERLARKHSIELLYPEDSDNKEKK